MAHRSTCADDQAALSPGLHKSLEIPPARLATRRTFPLSYCASTPASLLALGDELQCLTRNSTDLSVDKSLFLASPAQFNFATVYATNACRTQHSPRPLEVTHCGHPGASPSSYVLRYLRCSSDTCHDGSKHKSTTRVEFIQSTHGSDDDPQLPIQAHRELAIPNPPTSTRKFS